MLNNGELGQEKKQGREKFPRPCVQLIPVSIYMLFFDRVEGNKTNLFYNCLSLFA